MRLFQEQLRKTVSFSGGETVREIEFIPAEFEEIPLRAHLIISLQATKKTNFYRPLIGQKWANFFRHLE